MVDMLKYTAVGFGANKSQVGGKTGTTNDYVDGWFIGITPSLVVGTWVGGEDQWIRFNTLADGQGSVMAKPFFKAFLNRLETTPDVDYDSSLKFAVPEGGLDIETDCEKYNAVRKDDLYEQFTPAETFEEEFNENE